MWIFDRLTIPVAIGAAMVRLGNFFNSEINGKVTEASSFLATRFVRDSDDMPAYRALQLTGKQDVNEAYKSLTNDPQFASILEGIPYRHPAQLYEAIFYVAIFGLLYWLYWKKGKGAQSGFLFGLFMILLWSVRFVVEFVKKSQGGFENPDGVLSTGQWLSIPFILLGIFLMFRKSGQKAS
jgi:prolipoprotein diacylglyceryltransferase